MDHKASFANIAVTFRLILAVSLDGSNDRDRKNRLLHKSNLRL